MEGTEKKRIAIMQPYFFPYLGYWQLMNAVDEYVICDDVNYIKQGWIDRNQIKGQNGVQRIRLSLDHASQNRLIKDHSLKWNDTMKESLLKTLRCSYAKAPYFRETMELIEPLILNPKENLSDYLTDMIMEIASYFGMKTKFCRSSELNHDPDLKNQDMVLDICKIMQADVYINSIGGTNLYSFELFRENGIELKFLKMNDDIIYPQGKNEFIPNLSIIDVMMFNSIDQIKELLTKFIYFTE